MSHFSKYLKYIFTIIITIEPLIFNHLDFNISQDSNLDVENDVASVDSQMNSMDDDDNDVEDDD